jgi:hypothetical protein
VKRERKRAESLARPAAALAVAAAALAASACQREPTDRTSVEAKASMLASLAARFRTEPAAIEQRAFRQVIWSDDCYGIVLERECAPGTFFGYELEVAVGGELFAYHALVDDPFAVMLAEGPDPRIGIPALSWQWTTEASCQSLVVAPDGLAAIGLCGGPHDAHALLEENGRLEEWQHFYGRFAPFELVTVDHAVSLQGPGLESASAAWQRAVAAWAALQWSEIQGGGAAPESGRGLFVTRPAADQPGGCHFVEVTEYGLAVVTRGPCDGAVGDGVTWGWLDDGSWELVGDWFATWSSVYDTQLGIEFYTSGTNAVGEADKTRVLEVADQIIARIGAPAPAAPPSGAP